jgi:hypothetical protein
MACQLGLLLCFPPSPPNQSSLPNFIGFAYQGKKEIVIRFIIEYYSSFMDFGPS